MSVRGHRGGRRAVVLALFAIVGIGLFPAAASATKTLSSSEVIDTHRVIGALIGPSAPAGMPRLANVLSGALRGPSFRPNVVVARTSHTARSSSAVPSIKEQPSNRSVKAGARTSFVAAASGSPTVTVHWKESSNGKTWSTIKGATKPTYTFVASVRQEGFRFEAVFRDAAGSVTTHVVTLTVISAPFVTLQPIAASVQSGQPVSFSATATASPRPSVRWEMSTNGSSWTLIAGATSDTYAFTAALGQSGEQFAALFKNSHGQTRTHVALLTVMPAPIAPAIVGQPLSVSVSVGATATFIASASGSPAPSVQWDYSVNGSPWAPIPGATSPTYSFAAPATGGGTEFEAVFSNDAGSATSAPAELTVYAAPVITLQPVSQTVASGSSVSFTAGASGTPAPSVQWEYSTDDGASWQAWGGNTATTLTFVASGGQSLFQFEAVFSNQGGTGTTAPAVLTVTQGAIVGQASNWSGYADYNTSPGSNTRFTAISSTWTVPQLTCPGTSTSYSSEWIGIDGYTSNSTSVEQDGTEMDCINGTPQYDAWFEMYGDIAVGDGDEMELSPSTYPVNFGDAISASVSVSPSNMWTLSLNDATAGWSYTETVYFTAPESSAEWIVERPELCSSTCVLPALADFGVSSFANARVTSSAGAGSINDFVNDQIYMLGNTDNVLAAPGAVSSSGTSFTDTWSGSS